MSHDFDPDHKPTLTAIDDDDPPCEPPPRPRRVRYDDDPPTLLQSSLEKSNQLLKAVWFRSANITSETLASEERVRQVGFIYVIYRIMVALFLVFANYTADKSLIKAYGVFASILPESVGRVVVLVYFFVAICLATLFYFYQENFRKQLIAGFGLDIAILALFLYSSVATDLQVVLLYMVVTATSFMLLRLAHAIVLALCAVVFLGFQQVLFLLKSQVGFLSLGDSLMLSVSLVAVGFLSWSISQRLAIAEQASIRQEREIMRLNAINEEVIKNIETGILVVANSGRILMMNRTAQILLDLSPNRHFANNLARMMEIQRMLVKKYPEFDKWFRYKTDEPYFLLTPTSEVANRTNRLKIVKKSLPEFGKLLIVEDLSLEQHLAQQMKLASLGQLSASIAHEIRNPLGVISQASEFLIEMGKENDSDDPNIELYEMIFNHTKRVNRIIEDVMRLSRQEPPKQEELWLNAWFESFLSQYYPNESVVFLYDGNHKIRFDPSQLEQIFINLINNAIRHTKPLPDEADVTVVVHTTSQDVLIDVLDNGDGVDEKGLQSLFDPFFTTSKGGTGLGLYLSQAFSEANNARLVYVPNQPKTCFRLIAKMVNEWVNLGLTNPFQSLVATSRWSGCLYDKIGAKAVRCH